MICTVDQRQLFRKNGWPAKADIVKAQEGLFRRGRHAGDATARKALRKIATCAKSDATERVYAVEWLGQIGEDKDAKALENIDTGPADVLLAQRVHDAVKSIQYRVGWAESPRQGGEGDGGEEDEPKDRKRRR